MSLNSMDFMIIFRYKFGFRLAFRQFVSLKSVSERHEGEVKIQHSPRMSMIDYMVAGEDNTLLALVDYNDSFQYKEY